MYMSIYKDDKDVKLTPEEWKYYQELRKIYHPPAYVPHLKPFKRNKFKRK